MAVLVPDGLASLCKQWGEEPWAQEHGPCAPWLHRAHEDGREVDHWNHAHLATRVRHFPGSVWEHGYTHDSADGMGTRTSGAAKTPDSPRNAEAATTVGSVNRILILRGYIEGGFEEIGPA